MFTIQLGLVIDLTNTTRYYLVTEWKKEGIKHVKVSNSWLDCLYRKNVDDFLTTLYGF